MIDVDGLEIEGDFLNAEDLGIKEEDRCALIKTLAYIEAGKIKHLPRNNWGKRFGKDILQQLRSPSADEPLQGEHIFNMMSWRNRYDCGTVCCLGGTAEMLKGCSVDKFQSPEMADLFGLVGNSYLSMDHMTEKHGAAALRNYLTTGKAKWDEVRKTVK